MPIEGYPIEINEFDGIRNAFVRTVENETRIVTVDDTGRILSYNVNDLSDNEWDYVVFSPEKKGLFEDFDFLNEDCTAIKVDGVINGQEVINEVFPDHFHFNDVDNNANSGLIIHRSLIVGQGEPIEATIDDPLEIDLTSHTINYYNHGEFNIDDLAQANPGGQIFRHRIDFVVLREKEGDQEKDSSQ